MTRLTTLFAQNRHFFLYSPTVDSTGSQRTTPFFPLRCIKLQAVKFSSQHTICLTRKENGAVVPWITQYVCSRIYWAVACRVIRRYRIANLVAGSSLDIFTSQFLALIPKYRRNMRLIVKYLNHCVFASVDYFCRTQKLSIIVHLREKLSCTCYIRRLRFLCPSYTHTYTYYKLLYV